MKALLFTQLAATWAMVGLIWFVQLVHYPLFEKVGTEQFTDYEQLHQRWTTWVVGPLMLAELAATVGLCFLRPTMVPAWQTWLGLALLAIIWLSTACLQVPAHQALSLEFTARQHAKLVNTNWIRTIAWSLRGVLALAMINLANQAKV